MRLDAPLIIARCATRDREILAGHAALLESTTAALDTLVLVASATKGPSAVTDPHHRDEW